MVWYKKKGEGEREGEGERDAHAMFKMNCSLCLSVVIVLTVAEKMEHLWIQTVSFYFYTGCLEIDNVVINYYYIFCYNMP